MIRAALVALLGLGALAPWMMRRPVLGPSVPHSQPLGPGSTAAARRRQPSEAAALAAAPGVKVDRAVLLDLVAIARAAGVPVPSALGAVGRAVGGPDGRALGAAGAALRLGASWEEAWWSCPSRLMVVRDALGRVWLSGASPAGVLRSAADQVRRSRRRAVRQAAARLGARLVIPLGLCHLPAFVLLGLVPVLISLGRGLV